MSARAIKQSGATRRGFMLGDFVMGLGLVAVLSVILASSIGRKQATEDRLSDLRAAQRVAEHALLNLQHGQPLPTLSGDVQIAVRSAVGGEAPAGYTWAAVDVTLRNRRATLVGLLPSAAMRAGGMPAGTGGNQ
jgi:hypothetical protein